METIVKELVVVEKDRLPTSKTHPIPSMMTVFVKVCILIKALEKSTIHVSSHAHFSRRDEMSLRVIEEAVGFYVSLSCEEKRMIEERFIFEQNLNDFLNELVSKDSFQSISNFRKGYAVTCHTMEKIVVFMRAIIFFVFEKNKEKFDDPRVLIESILS